MSCFRCEGFGVYWGYDPLTKSNDWLRCGCVSPLYSLESFPVIYS